MHIFSLLSKKPDNRIEAFKTAERENAAALNQIGKWLVHESPEAAVQADLVRYGNDPFNFELGESILARWSRWEAEKPMRLRLAATARPTVDHQILARLRPAAKGALQAVIERLESELESAQRDDLKRASKYGVSVKPSAETSALADEIERAKGYLGQMDSPTMNCETMASLVNQVLLK